MTTTVTFTKAKVEGNESPFDITEGETRYFVCNYWDTVSTPVVTAYQSSSGSGNGIDVTSTVFPTNSPTSSGISTTLSAATGFEGGKEYVINVTGTVSGEVFVKYFRIRVRKAKSL